MSHAAGGQHGGEGTEDVEERFLRCLPLGHGLDLRGERKGLDLRADGGRPRLAVVVRGDVDDLGRSHNLHLVGVSLVVVAERGRQVLLEIPQRIRDLLANVIPQAGAIGRKAEREHLLRGLGHDVPLR